MCWPSQDRIPFIFLHGMADTLVPIRHARKLFAALPRGNKAFIQVRATDSRESGDRRCECETTVGRQQGIPSCGGACPYVPLSS